MSTPLQSHIIFSHALLFSHHLCKVDLTLHNTFTVCCSSALLVTSDEVHYKTSGSFVNQLQNTSRKHHRQHAHKLSGIYGAQRCRQVAFFIQEICTQGQLLMTCAAAAVSTPASSTSDVSRIKASADARSGDSVR